MQPSQWVLPSRAPEAAYTDRQEFLDFWGELNDQVLRWIERINEYGITKWVLYLSALEEGDRLDVHRIQRELREREGRDVPIETVRDVLIKLSRGDLLQYRENFSPLCSSRKRGKGITLPRLQGTEWGRT